MFRTFLKLESIDSFKSGEYELLNKSLTEIFILFKEGKTITHKLTIQEGSTIYDLQKLLDIIHENPEYYPGSFHEDVDISEIIQIIYDVLYNNKDNTSLHLIIDKNPNNSLDLTIDKIESHL